jgi:pSer/pThr/pTyr-binding forkhead associated (FHA) protein
MVFALDNYGKQELTLGRYDARTGESPDIDLSEEPNGNTVSRPHALLRQQGAQWMLIPVSTKNPTTIDGIQIPQGRPHPLHHGNVITLGDVDLIFETSP